MDVRKKIAKRAALELTDGDMVNLGFGIPTMVANCIPSGVHVVLQTENGALNMGPTPEYGQQCSDTANAGGMPVTLLEGASVFDVATAFGMIRGGHIDVSILGALQVDQTASIANWSMPGRMPGMGGAMDLVACTRKIIVTMEHCNKKGQSKFLKECTLPLTGRAVVSLLVTDRAVFSFEGERPLLLEKDSDISLEDLRSITDAEFDVSPDLCEYRQ